MKKTPSSEYTQYRNPLVTRYASASMSGIFSEQHRAGIWRELWIYLAEEEKKLGIPIKAKQIQAMKAAQDKIDFKRVRKFEKELKHDVMSHVKAFAAAAPEAEPIIHLGATSCYVTDNSDALILKQAAELVLNKLALVIEGLGQKVSEYKSLAMTGFTHFQPAQPVTLGKRISLWVQDLIWDFEELEYALSRLRPLGCKGATGTQASFMVLFENDYKKVQQLDEAICKRLGFDRPVEVSGQTLSRKVDSWFLNALAALAGTYSKMSYDLRLLQHLGEVKEGFGKKQIGSSAMAYKRNPILAERISSLSRFAINSSHNAQWTHATQWLERSLDDSANRRIAVAETFMCLDALNELALRVVETMDVDEVKIQERIGENLAFFETEEKMMRGTLAGGSRQQLHEEVRMATVKGKIKKTARKDNAIFVGAADKQAADFFKRVITPFLKRNKARLNKKTAVGTDAI